MLPFMQKKTAQSGLIVKERQTSQEQAPKAEETELVDILIDSLNAYKSRDIKLLAMLLKEMHEAMHKYMDKEESSDNSYDSLNKAAGRDNAAD